MSKSKKSNKTYFCFAYPSDLDNAYAFYCARYENISFEEFLKLGITDFTRKFRTIDTNKIKDKEERRYWNKLKRLNAIPSEYISTREIMLDLTKMSKEYKV